MFGKYLFLYAYIILYGTALIIASLVVYSTYKSFFKNDANLVLKKFIISILLALWLVVVAGFILIFFGIRLERTFDPVIITILMIIIKIGAKIWLYLSNLL